MRGSYIYILVVQRVIFKIKRDNVNVCMDDEYSATLTVRMMQHKVSYSLLKVNLITTKEVASNLSIKIN